MLSNIVALIVYYGIGIVGAWLGLEALIYCLSNYVRLYKLDEKDIKLSKFNKLVLDMYRWIGIDFEKDRTLESRLPTRLVIVLGSYAALGTIAFNISFILGVLSIILVVVCTLSVKEK